MTNLKVSVITFFLLFLIMTGQAQTVKTVEDIAMKNQACLDSGVDMLGCSKYFYFQMDSMLNVVYDKTRATLNPTEKAALKDQQLAWLKKRDIYFKKQDKVFRDNDKKGEGGQDMEMITYQEKADFVKKRVIALIKNFKKG